MQGRKKRRAAPRLGVNVFLPKPITASSMFDAVVEAQGARVHAARRALDAPLEREFDARVLLAEDNEANQMVASEILGRLGIELDIANNGREALEMVRAARDKYAAVLMDVQMPEMDGLDGDAGDAQRPDVARPADHRDDRQRDEVGSRCVPRCRDERSHHQAHRTKGALADAAPLVAGAAEAFGACFATGAASAAVADDAPALEGIDVAGSLERLGLEFATFHRMLVRFADGQGAMLDALRAAVASGDSAAVGKTCPRHRWGIRQSWRRGPSYGCQGARARRSRG